MDNTEKQNQKSQVDKSTEEQEAYLKVVKPLRTYERDLATQVRESGASAVSVHLKEREKRRTSKKTRGQALAIPKFAKLRPVLIVLIILVVVSTLVFITFSFLTNPQSLKEVSEEKGISIVRADSIITIDLSEKDRRGIVRAFQENLGTPPSGLWVTNFLLTEKNVLGIVKPLSSEGFLSKLGEQVPAKLLRAAGSVINIGFITFGSTREGFLLIEVDSFENAFSGMLEWEKSVVTDLEFLITSDSDNPSGSFRDIVLKNKDSRILRDKSGKSILIYSFIEKDLLLIARNEETFREILDRQVAAKFRD